MNTKNFVEYWDDLDNLPVSQVLFVGLSYKLNKNWQILEAFCDSTNSWKVIQKLEEWCSWISVHKTNLVKWVPLNNGKIRYPNSKEKEEWLCKLLEEILVIKPQVVYLFGKQVSDFIIKNTELEKVSNFEYNFWNIIFVLAYHPSYMYIYKRKELDNYVNWIVLRILEILWKR